MANIAIDAGKVVLKDGKASCTCCATGGCGCFITSGALKSIIDMASTVYVNGTPTPWNPALTIVNNTPPTPSAVITYSSGTLCITADDGTSSSWLLPAGKTVAECGNPISPFPPGPDIIVVNGITLQAVNWFGSTMPQTPNIVFT